MEEQNLIKVVVKIVSAVEYTFDVEADNMEEATIVAEEFVHDDEDMGLWLKDTMVVTSVTEVKEVVSE